MSKRTSADFVVSSRGVCMTGDQFGDRVGRQDRVRKRLDDLRRADEVRLSRSARLDAMDYQEQHDPSEPVMVKLTAERETVRCRRRLHDARLWDAMDGDQERAADRVLAAYDVMAGPVRTAAMCFERTDGRPLTAEDDERAQERLAKLLTDYVAWRRQCRAERLDDKAIIAVICEGMGLRDADRAFRHRNGWSRQQVLDGLSLYCSIKGWGSHGATRTAA